MIHPVLEKIKYPGPGDRITEEFKAYVYYALLEEENAPGLSHIVHNAQTFQEFLEYCKTYKLWHQGWTTLVQIYTRVKILQQLGDYAEGRGPCKI